VQLSAESLHECAVKNQTNSKKYESRQYLSYLPEEKNENLKEGREIYNAEVYLKTLSAAQTI
jgi:hypothetical protein